VDGKKESSLKKDVYQVVTDRIIRLLESGTVPWRRPWKGGNQAPRNFVSRKAYRGINQFLLNAARYPSPFWLTFKQVQTLGGRVKKGEHSFPVVFWKIFKEEGDSEEKRIPFLRYYSVFNVAQCEGIPEDKIPSLTGTKRQHSAIEAAQQIVAAMPKRPVIQQKWARAFYSPDQDFVGMPELELFRSPTKS